MKIKFILISLLILAAVGFANSTSAGLPEAVAYLKNQAPDAWITQALIAAGEIKVSTDYLKSVAAGGFNPTNDYAKTILALAAAGKNPTTFGEIDYVAKLKTYYDGVQMGDAALLNDDVWSVLAFASIKKADSAEAIASKNFILDHQNADGGWGYTVGGSSGSNDTAAAIMALIEAGVNANSAAITKAVAFLHTRQNDDGGFINDPAWGTASDSGSDGWVISAIYKIGQDPISWTKKGNNPLAHLQSLQDNADGGFFWVDPASSPAFNNKAMTPYAVIALAGKSFPVGYFEIPQPTPTPAPISTPVEQLDTFALEASGLLNGQTDNFIASGTLSTAKLGTGERAGVLSSYKSSFGRLPQTQAEWKEIIRISNNQLPLVTISEAEEKAKIEFKKVYQREADINNFNDQAAINLMAYGLRPDRRDLNSERAGIRVFIEIYKYLPVSALDWDTVRAIAYSGISL